MFTQLDLHRLHPTNKCRKVKAPKRTTKFQRAQLPIFLLGAHHHLYQLPHDRHLIACRWTVQPCHSPQSHPPRTNAPAAFHLPYQSPAQPCHLQHPRLVGLHHLPHPRKPLQAVKAPQSRFTARRSAAWDSLKKALSMRVTTILTLRQVRNTRMRSRHMRGTQVWTRASPRIRP
jgi:hypothetical protein